MDNELKPTDDDNQSNFTFTFKSETDGLWGQAFFISAIVINHSGEVVDQFIGKSNIDSVKDGWAVNHILPTLISVEVTHESYERMLKAFARFYMKWENNSTMVINNGYMIETKVIRDMYDFGFIGEWDAPAPLYDVVNFLQMAEECPGIEYYAQSHGLLSNYSGKVPPESTLHDPYVIGIVYNHLASLKLS